MEPEMDLKTFVSETLTQIVEGVADAKQRLEAGGTGARINPVRRDTSNRPHPSEAKPVEFDLALTVTQQSAETSTSRGDAKAGIVSVFQAKVGADLAASSGNQSQEVSRVKFTVMLAQPSEISVDQPIQIPTGNTRW